MFRVTPSGRTSWQIFSEIPAFTQHLSVTGKVAAEESVPIAVMIALAFLFLNQSKKIKRI